MVAAGLDVIQEDPKAEQDEERAVTSANGEQQANGHASASSALGVVACLPICESARLIPLFKPNQTKHCNYLVLAIPTPSLSGVGA